MTIRAALALAASIAALTPLQAVGAGPAEKDAAALMAVDRAFAAKAREIGVGPAFQLYAADRVMMVSLPEPDIARADLAKVFPPNFQLEWEPKAAAISDDGTLGYTWGTARSRVTGADGAVRELPPGRYITVWRREADGSWKFISDAAVTDPTAAKPDAAKK